MTFEGSGVVNSPSSLEASRSPACHLHHRGWRIEQKHDHVQLESHQKVVKPSWGDGIVGRWTGAWV